MPEDYSRFVESFPKEHSLPHFAESFSERLGEELLKLSTRSSKKTCAEKRGSKRLLPSSTDSLHFSFYGLEKKLGGLAVNKGYATGKVAVLAEAADCDKVRKGDIVVFVKCNPDLIGAVPLAGALIADRGGFTGHAAIVGRELPLPTIVGTGKGTEILKDGMHVFVDAMQGIVYEIRD